MRIQVFEAPVCCPGGPRGPSTPYIQFANDVAGLRARGVIVERSGLPATSSAAAHADTVLKAVRRHGIDCLPLTLADGEVVAEGAYPDRSTLARLAGLSSVATRE